MGRGRGRPKKSVSASSKHRATTVIQEVSEDEEATTVASGDGEHVTLTEEEKDEESVKGTENLSDGKETKIM